MFKWYATHIVLASQPLCHLALSLSLGILFRYRFTYGLHIVCMHAEAHTHRTFPSFLENSQTHTSLLALSLSVSHSLFRLMSVQAHKSIPVNIVFFARFVFCVYVSRSQRTDLCNVNINAVYRFSTVWLIAAAAAVFVAAAFPLWRHTHTHTHNQRFKAIKISECTFWNDYQFWSLINDKPHVFCVLHVWTRRSSYYARSVYRVYVVFCVYTVLKPLSECNAKKGKTDKKESRQ